MSDTTYPSIAANLIATGVHRLIFRNLRTELRGVTLVTALPGHNIAVAEWNPNTQTILEVLSAGHALGSLAGERVSDSLLQDLARHASNPFRLAGHEGYIVTTEDHSIVEWGTIDGQRCVWDQLIVPHLGYFGLSVDPGVVPRNAPDGLGVQPPAAGGTDDPALKALQAAQEALRALADFYVVPPAGPPVPITSTPAWKEKVAPLLVAPFMSS